MTLGPDKHYYREQVQKVLKAANIRRNRRTFRPNLNNNGFWNKFHRENEKKDACRIYGQLELHKCHGDFHITAKGHGYLVLGQEHIDHESIAPWVAFNTRLIPEINFTHVIDEFSFGEFFPNIINPLDEASASTEERKT
jgi:Endoplasmic reticulum vesicle transporter